MNEYIYRLELIERLNKDDNWTDEDNQIVDKHFNYLKELLNQNKLILAGRTTNEDKFGIVIFEAETDEDAQEIMNNDPAILNGIMTGQLYPYRVALMRKG
ncbi:MAG: hypothetical protein HGA35_02995 [Erysipelotrichaceae bacterium]|nr:hypothetical protein [Erysipelotrichaceae bacterium]